jgi:hypothetical protein
MLFLTVIRAALTSGKMLTLSAVVSTAHVNISTLFSLRRGLTVVDSADMTVPLHLPYERTKEEAQLASKTPSGRQTGFEETCRVWCVREN